MMVNEQNNSIDKKTNSEDSLSEIDNIAISWLVRIQSGEFSECERRELSAWVAVSSAHQSALQRLAELWQKSAQTEALLFAAECEQPPAKPLSLDAAVSLKQRLRAKFEGWRAPSTYWKSGAVALAATVLLFALIYPKFFVDQAVQEVYSSNHSGNTAVTLSDGSSVNLSGKSAISVNISRDYRRVDLVSGAAFFDVSSDPTRPFRVRTPKLEVEVVGTVFEVKTRANGVQVSVKEGRVSVAIRNAKQQSITLKAGQKTDFVAGELSEIQGFDAEKELQWLGGRLDYDNAPLINVLDDVNRYREKPIILANKNLASLKVSASFAIDQSNELLEGLAITHQLRAVETSTAIVLN